MQHNVYREVTIGDIMEEIHGAGGDVENNILGEIYALEDTFIRINVYDYTDKCGILAYEFQTKIGPDKWVTAGSGTIDVIRQDSTEFRSIILTLIRLVAGTLLRGR